LETFDGSYVPVSPERPDVVLYTSAIALRLEHADTRAVVPLVECELDPETGIQRTLGIALADPWGPMKQGSGYSYDTETTTLLDWFAQVTRENRTYAWPARRRISPRLEWASRLVLAEDELSAMPVGTAIAVNRPGQAKRNRIRLNLYVQLEPGVWARGYY